MTLAPGVDVASATAVALGVSSTGFVSVAGAGAETAGAGGVWAMGEAIASDWAVIPSSARGLNALAANGGTASSETTWLRSMRPSPALSSTDRKREPSQRKM